ncbi:MAG TPA: SH3 domain-containing protein [Patescibacteria group bacterium]|nr:SH3 domain-containing protein [Patescibacteria group bacterium]
MKTERLSTREKVFNVATIALLLGALWQADTKSSHAQECANGTLATVLVNGTRIRENPNTSSNVVWVLQAGDQVIMTGSTNGQSVTTNNQTSNEWEVVETKDCNFSGYTSKTLLSETNNETDLAQSFELVIDPTISIDLQSEIQSQVDTWRTSVMIYYPSLRNQSDLQRTTYFVFSNGQSLRQLLPWNSPYRSLSAYALGQAVGGSEGNEAIFNINHAGSVRDIRFSHEWSHLVQSSLNINNSDMTIPFWFKEGLAQATAMDLTYGLQDWHTSIDAENFRNAFFLFQENPTLSDLTGPLYSGLRWQYNNPNAYALSTLAIEYIATFSPQGTVDLAYQILKLAYQKGDFFSAVQQITGLNEQEFYAGFTEYYLSLQTTRQIVVYSP